MQKPPAPPRFNHHAEPQKLALCPPALWVCKAHADIDTSLAWTRVTSAARGLDNNGNTCFLNATLQCLAHTPALVQMLVDRQYVSRSQADSAALATRLLRLAQCSARPVRCTGARRQLAHIAPPRVVASLAPRLASARRWSALGRELLPAS